jgi:hypothetical protein
MYPLCVALTIDSSVSCTKNYSKNLLNLIIDFYTPSLRIISFSFSVHVIIQLKNLYK